MKGRDHVEDIGMDGKMVLKFTLNGNRVERHGFDSSGSGGGFL
jgi:hypothetical protein